MNHELVLLAHQMDWSYFEDDFSQYYSHTGQPAMSIRLIRGLERTLDDKTLLKYATDLLLYAQVLEQKRTDKKKIIVFTNLLRLVLLREKQVSL
ncbi:hypothetical protein ACE193_22420 [Bernardetia sp. OM2101]|uniref:hypothetical protein n=1 Tax=Bernardetia sp. OM2101 TaxID=3344876 RepID=UPI0035CFC907